MFACEGLLLLFLAWNTRPEGWERKRRTTFPTFFPVPQIVRTEAQRLGVKRYLRCTCGLGVSSLSPRWPPPPSPLSSVTLETGWPSQKSWATIQRLLNPFAAEQGRVLQFYWLYISFYFQNNAISYSRLYPKWENKSLLKQYHMPLLPVEA